MSKRRRRSRRPRGTVHWQRAGYPVQERARKVGPEHFGALTVDCSKKHFELLLTDFYGKPLMGPTTILNNKPSIDSTIQQLKREMENHGLKDMVAGIERTGRYHEPIRRALKSHWDVVMIHPFATKQLRQPAAPGTKTDGIDLRAENRALILGYATKDPELSLSWLEWQMINRAREDLVRKAATLRVQLHERLEAMMPGFAALFEDLWSAPVALKLVELYGSAEALLQTDAQSICNRLREAKQVARRGTVGKILVWAAQASSPEPTWKLGHRIACDQLRLLRQLESQVQQYEGDLVRYLVGTPFVLLLSMEGINVVSASSYGAEMGPIEHYLNGKRISGRAGIYPSRYQSDDTDRANGPLVGRRNARLRDAIIQVTHNLTVCNPYFKRWAQVRKEKGWPKKKIEVAAACKFVRISFQLLSERTVFDHPCVRSRDAILQKIFTFSRQHDIAPEDIDDLLRRAIGQIPRKAYKTEAAALKEQLPRRPRRKPCHRGQAKAVLIGKIMADVIEHLVTSDCSAKTQGESPPRKKKIGRTHNEPISVIEVSPNAAPVHGANP